MRAPTNDEEQKVQDAIRAKERGDVWFASGRGIFKTEADFQIASVSVSPKWLEDTAMVVALLNAGQAAAILRAALAEVVEAGERLGRFENEMRERTKRRMTVGDADRLMAESLKLHDALRDAIAKAKAL